MLKVFASVFICVGFAVGQVYIPTGVSTQSGIVRNVPTTLLRLPADTLFTDGNRAYVAAQVPLHWVGTHHGLGVNNNGNSNNNNNNNNGNSNNNNNDEDNSRRNSANGDNEWRRNDNNQQDQHRASRPEEDLIRFTDENRRSDEDQNQNQNNNNNDNNDQRHNSQQYKTFSQNGSDQTKSSPFNSEQLRAFNNNRSHNKHHAERYRTTSSEDSDRTDSHRSYDSNEHTNRRS